MRVDADDLDLERALEKLAGLVTGRGRAEGLAWG